MFSLYTILPVTACNMLSSSPSSCQNVTVKLCCVGIHFLLFSPLSPLASPSFAFVLCSLFTPVFFLTLSTRLSNFSHHLLLLFLCPHTLFLLQSLSAPQAQALSCVESLCCYQHGQSGCSRLASLLEQMTGQCQASTNHCHASSRSNRWGGRCQERNNAYES